MRHSYALLITIVVGIFLEIFYKFLWFHLRFSDKVPWNVFNFAVTQFLNRITKIHFSMMSITNKFHNESNKVSEKTLRDGPFLCKCGNVWFRAAKQLLWINAVLSMARKRLTTMEGEVREKNSPYTIEKTATKLQKPVPNLWENLKSHISCFKALISIYCLFKKYTTENTLCARIC